MLGSTYSLVALGYTLIFGILNQLHFAHGEVFMIGAFIGLQMVLLAHANIVVAIRWMMKMMAYQSITWSSVSTIGVSIIPARS